MTDAVTPADLAPIPRRRVWDGCRRSLRPAAEALGAGVVLLAVWQLLAVTVFADSYALAAPTDVVRELVDNWSVYWPSVVSTARIALWGFVIGNAVAIVMALAVVEIPFVGHSLTRVVLAVYCVPMIALAPIVQVLLREGDQAKIVLSALAVIFTTMVAAVLGLRAADTTAQDVVAVLGGGRGAVLRKVRFRYALPALFAGLRIAAPAAVLGATVAEFLGADRGLGVLIVNALSGLGTTQVWTVAVIATALSGIGFLAVGIADRVVNGWSRRVLLTGPPHVATTSASSAVTALRTLAGLVWTTVLLLVVWAIAIEVSGLDRFFAKSPVDVWTLLTDGPRAAADRELLFGGLGTTMRHAASGFVLGIAAGSALAAAFVLLPVAERAVMPVAITLRSVPILATIPLVILVLGRGEMASTVTVAILSFFPTLVNVLAGLRSTRLEVVELLGVYDCSSFTILCKARVPTALPSLFASARIAVPASVLGAVVVEWLSTGEGLGNAILVGAFNARYGILWAAAAVLCAVTMLCYAGVTALEHIALRRFAPEQLGR